MGGLSSSGRASLPLSPKLRSLTRYGPGILLCAAIALPAYELSGYHQSLDALAISLIAGIVLRNVLGPITSVQPGVSLTSAVFIPVGIMLYGTRLDFHTFSQLPLYTTGIVIFGMAAYLMVIMAGTTLLGIDRRTGLLLASGSAICGASAIAVLSPGVGARSRETSMALIVITTVGLTGALVYPLLADAFSMSITAYGAFSGATLQQTGIVKLAASHMGDEALALALSVKMVRIAMLAPLALILSTASSIGAGWGRKQKGDSAFGQALRRTWFIPFFVLVAVLFTYYEPIAAYRQDVGSLATICLSLALAGIGLTVSFDSIRSEGSRPLILGFAGWAMVSALMLFVFISLFK